MKKISLLVTLLICLCASTVFAYSSTYYPEDVATVMENSMDGDKVIFIGKLTCENEKNETVELKNADEISQANLMLKDETGQIRAEIDAAKVRLYKVELNKTMRFFGQYVNVGDIEKFVIQRVETI
ncbi:hypothetical protein [Anaerosinus sp.]|uniref:hypothetical protein n=1 Tax=Selenobaculum sp. TaxID=3074374 RepID=UPI0015AD43F5